MKKIIFAVLILCAAASTNAYALTLTFSDGVTGNVHNIGIDTTDSTANVTVDVSYTSPAGVVSKVFSGLATNLGGTKYSVVIPRLSFPAVAISEIGTMSVSALDQGVSVFDPGFTLGGTAVYSLTLTPAKLNARHVILTE